MDVNYDSLEQRFTVEAKTEDADGNVSDANGSEEPDFWGVYERLKDGTSRHLADFWTCIDAEACRDAIVDVLVRWLESEEEMTCEENEDS